MVRKVCLLGAIATTLAALTLNAPAAPANKAPSLPSAAGITVTPAHHPSRQEHSMTAAVADQALLVGARDAAQRVLSFLSNATITTDFTVANIGRQLGITLAPDPDNGKGWFVYRSPDLGYGWNYGAQFAEAKAPLKPTFMFWFYNTDHDARIASACALPWDQLRTTLTTHGWVERTVSSEIGSILAIEFAKRELLLTLTPHDIALSGDAKCVMYLQASGGH